MPNLHIFCSEQPGVVKVLWLNTGTKRIKAEALQNGDIKHAQQLIINLQRQRQQDL